MTGYEPPPRGFGILKRALVACVLIVAMSAAAVASAAILQVDDVLDIVREEGRAPIALPEIDAADVGGPQTLMILGSDERFDDKKNGAGRPRSDTIILVRLDKNNDAISVMSLPRDLKVTIPGNSLPTKINGAYEQGGERLTLRTVKKVLSTPGRRFKINHLVTIGFESFQRAINYVGCVYYDVDRRYYNDNSAGENYARSTSSRATRDSAARTRSTTSATGTRTTTSSAPRASRTSSARSRTRRASRTSSTIRATSRIWPPPSGATSTPTPACARRSGSSRSPSSRSSRRASRCERSSSGSRARRPRVPTCSRAARRSGRPSTSSWTRRSPSPRAPLPASPQGPPSAAGAPRRPPATSAA
jgi:LCP family protein required for cell wall assembly